MVTTNVYLDASDDFPKSESGVRAIFPTRSRPGRRVAQVPSRQDHGLARKEDVYPSPEQISLIAVR
jgi:hypothetical protein